MAMKWLFRLHTVIPFVLLQILSSVKFGTPLTCRKLEIPSIHTLAFTISTKTLKIILKSTAEEATSMNLAMK